jgi:hypothetical protein
VFFFWKFQKREKLKSQRRAVMKYQRCGIVSILYQYKCSLRASLSTLLNYCLNEERERAAAAAAALKCIKEARTSPVYKHIAWRAGRERNKNLSK